MQFTGALEFDLLKQRPSDPSSQPHIYLRLNIFFIRLVTLHRNREINYPAPAFLQSACCISLR